MKPPVKKMEYEKVPTNDFVSGFIEEIIYDENHMFKGFKGSPDEAKPAVRIVFVIEGLKFPKKTSWMKFNYSAKSNLYKKYISSLVENPKEYMDFDLDQLKGLKVKMLWADNGEFQNIETIRPADGKKVVPLNTEKAA